MQLNVDKNGLLVPYKFLKGIKKVNIKKINGEIIITPVSKDSITNLGKNPVEIDIKDGSENHNKYLYP